MTWTAPGASTPFPLQALRRVLQLLALHAFVKRAAGREDTVRMFGLKLRVPPTVFHPRLYGTSRFLGRYLVQQDLRQSALLDVGCGSGILSLVAAQRGAEVTAVDIHPLAVDSTRRNARENAFAERIRALESDLFEGLPATSAFDVIVWNPPFYPRAQTDHASMAWNAGESYDVIRRFAASVGDHIRPGGRIIMVTSSDAGEGAIFSSLAHHGFTAVPARARRGIFEKLSIVEFRRHPAS